MYTLHDMNAMQAHRLVSLGYDLRLCTCKHSPPRRVWKQKIHATSETSLGPKYGART